jgi:hypothetical protein
VITDNVTDVNCSGDNVCSRFENDWLCSLAGKCEPVNLQFDPAYSPRYEYDHENEELYIANTSHALPKEAETIWLVDDL